MLFSLAKRLALLGFLFRATLAAQPASIAGVVVNHITGRPLAGVHLHFLTGDFGNGGLDQVYGAISDPAGHFSVTSLKPGIYVVISERAGFVQSPSARLPVSFVPLKPGQQLTDYKVEMTPRAVISGRVVDEYGDPVQNIAVILEPLSPSSQMESFSGRNNANTDDLGEFRLVTAPGRYHIRTNQFDLEQESGSEIRTDGTSAAPYAPTYYPSAATGGDAAVVEVAAGQDVAGLEIRLVRGAAAAARVLNISGVAAGAPDNARVSIVLRHGENAAEMYSSNQTTTFRDGKFTFRGLRPGFYRIFAQYSAGKIFLVSQTVDLTLDSSDETNVQLVLAPAGEITGTLEIAGDSAPAAPSAKLTVRLDAVDSMETGSDTTPGEVDQNGSFRVGKVSPGRFRPVVEPLPENAYIQSVTLDGAPAADNILDLSHGAKGSHLKITVSRDGAQVSGSVLDGEGKPLVSPLVMIFLATDPKQMRQDSGDGNRATEGKYTIKAIRPGKYRLFAVDALELFSAVGDADHDDDELMKALFNSAEEIEIKPGARIVKDLKAIDKPPGKEPPHAPQE